MPIDPISAHEARLLAMRILKRRAKRIEQAKDQIALITALADMKGDLEIIQYARDVAVRDAIKSGIHIERIAWLTSIPRASIQRFSNRTKYTYSEGKKKPKPPVETETDD